jgi:GldM C-terminal domain
MYRVLLLGIMVCVVVLAKAQNMVVAEKMNVFYIGVENPVLINAGNIPEKELEFSLSQGKIEKITGRANSYTIKVSTPGDMTLNVNHKGKTVSKQQFHVKRIPNPAARLPMYERSNEVTAATLRTITGMITVLENFDAKCTITQFSCIYKSVDNKSITIRNEGMNFNTQLTELIKKAKIGDLFIFQEVKAKCPEDVKERLLNDIVIGVK